MRLTLAANDIGPAQNLGMVAQEALLRGHRVSMVGNDDVGSLDITTNPPNVLITGLSSFRNEEELALGRKAEGKNIPWIVHADTYRSWGNQNARNRISHAIALVADETEIQDARDFGYGDVRYLGKPPLWQTYTKLTPAEITHTTSRVILVGGDKTGNVTNMICEKVISALRELFGDDWEMIFKPHPNEKMTDEDTTARSQILAGVKLIVSPERITRLISPADCIVLLAGSTDTIAAGHMRRPVVSLEDDERRARLASVKGSPLWLPAESGAAIKSEIENVREALAYALSKRGAAELRARQEQVYPLITNDDKRTESKIVRFLETC